MSMIIRTVGFGVHVNPKMVDVYMDSEANRTEIIMLMNQSSIVELAKDRPSLSITRGYYITGKCTSMHVYLKQRANANDGKCIDHVNHTIKGVTTV
jgi:hypothetical protein